MRNRSVYQRADIRPVTGPSRPSSCQGHCPLGTLQTPHKSTIQHLRAVGRPRNTRFKMGHSGPAAAAVAAHAGAARAAALLRPRPPRRRRVRQVPTLSLTPNAPRRRRSPRCLGRMRWRACCAAAAARAWPRRRPPCRVRVRVRGNCVLLRLCGEGFRAWFASCAAAAAVASPDALSPLHQGSTSNTPL